MRMKMQTYLMLVLMIASMTVNTSAQGLEKGYFGFNAGAMKIDKPDDDPAANFGLTIGGIITKQESMSLGLEAQLTTTAYEGNTSVGGLDWEIDTLGLYGALRLGTEAYFKLKGGYGKWQIITDSTTTDESDFAWGLGFGLPMRSGNMLEIEYAIIGATNSRDISYISLTYLFK